MIFFGFTIGDFTRNLRPETDYNGTNANYHHLVLTQSIRQVGSPFYNSTHRYMLQLGEEMAAKAKINNVVDLEVELVNGDISHTESGVHHRQNGIQTVAYHFIPKDPVLAAKKAITFSAHYDGHNVGGTAYDNAINVASLLELANTIASVDYPPPVPVHIVCIGSEEFGLSGAKIYVRTHSNYSHIMNLDSLGTGQPFGLLIKADKGASVELSAARVPGTILATFGSFFIKSGIVSSITDEFEFEAAGFTGAEMDFVGNPSHYHTSLDRMKGPEDITCSGNQLYYFLTHFKEHSSEDQWAILGISPIMILLPNKVMIGLSIVSFIATIALIIAWTVWKHVLSLRQVLLMLATWASHLVTMIICSLLVYAINTCSYCGVPGFAVFTWFTLSCCVFLGFANLYGASEFDQRVWHIGFSFLTSFFAIVLCWNDLALPYLWASMFSGLYYLVLYLPKYFRFLQPLIDFVALWPYIFEYMFLFTLILRYSPVMVGVFPEVFGVVVMWLYSNIMCFAIMGNSCSDKFVDNIKIRRNIWKILFGIAFVILLIFFVKRHPYSNEYCIKGSVAHTIYDNGTSHVSYITSVGSRVVPELKKLIRLHDKHEYVKDFVRPYGRGNAIVQRYNYLKRPSFINEWPTFHWEQGAWNGKERNATFVLDARQDDMDGVAFVLGCPDGKECVNHVDTFETIEHKKNANFGMGLFIRVVPVYLPFNMTFTFNTEKEVDMLECFIWTHPTPEREEFFKIFPTYVQHTMKMGILADTLLVNQTKI